MKLENKTLIDLDGNPIKMADGDLTLAVALLNCAVAPVDPKSAENRSETEIAARYEVAKTLRGIAVGESFDLPLDMVILLRKDVGRIWTVVVAGQVMQLLDGKSVH